MDAIFDGVWGKGLSGDNPEHWKTFCETVGLTEEEANEKISDPEIKSLLRKNGEEAIDAGVFGVPTMLIGDKLFWGNDCCEMLREYLLNPNLYESAEMKRLENLPRMWNPPEPVHL